MANDVWWKTTYDNGCVNEILKFSIDARKWYLKTDLKVRLKMFIINNENIQDVINIWKRLNIIKKDFGEDSGSAIIQQALKEIHDEFNDSEWEDIIHKILTHMRGGLNDDRIKMI
jgi:hypothetical protein